MKLKFSASSMLLLPQGWPEWHHFVLGFTRRSEDVGCGYNIIYLFLVLSR